MQTFRKKGQDRIETAARLLERRLCAGGIIANGMRWKLLAGGRTNCVWRISGAANVPDLVCKLSPPGLDTPLFPNAPLTEAAILRHLENSALSPGLVHAEHTEIGHCLIYRHIEGRVGGADAEALRGALEALHRHPAPRGLRKLSLDPRALLESGDAIVASLPRTLGRRLGCRRPMPVEIAAAGNVLLHGDPVPGNTITTRHGVRFIDWQCPAWGDPVFDYAVALSPAMNVLDGKQALSDAQRATLLADRDIAARFAVVEPIFLWRMAAYCAWRIARGAQDYLPALEVELERLDGLTEP